MKGSFNVKITPVTVSVFAIVLLLFLAVSINATNMFEGKMVMTRDVKVEVLKVLWGRAGELSKQDRIMGSVKVFLLAKEELPGPVDLVFNYKDNTNGVITTKTVVATAPNTPDVKGRQQEGKRAITFEFAADLDPVEGAMKLALSNVKYKGESVVYSVFFNVSGTVMKEKMNLPKPTIEPVKMK